MQKIKVKGSQFVKKMEWKQTDGQTDRPIALHFQLTRGVKNSDDVKIFIYVML